MKNILLILIILIILYKIYIGCYTSENFYNCKDDVQNCINSYKEISGEQLQKCNELCKKK
jgi:hypothetical protein